MTVTATVALTLGVTSPACGEVEPTYSPNAPCDSPVPKDVPLPRSKYPRHDDIKASVFWVGEPADESNGQIANFSSSWQEEWQTDFGGVDEPAADQRIGFCPKAFRPKQNPFYVALPYNDLEIDGTRKADAKRVVPWANESTNATTGSIVKNRWVEVSIGDRRCYGQWEDAGPFLENDAAYVFGSARPANTKILGAGIDLSPAVETCLGIAGAATVSWRFIDTADVPNGPWLVIQTR